MRERVVVEEILDTLPADDPEARQSRRDLRRINALMGNYRWIASRIRALAKEIDGWTEIGAGDGGISRVLDATVPVSGIDLAPRPENWPADWDWQQGDLFKLLPSCAASSQEGLIANLFLHHFEASELGRIGALAQDRFVRLVVSEPARYRIFHSLAHLLLPFVNRVTRHDMLVSIRAGFRRGELREALGLGPEWRIAEKVTLFGSLRLEAWREPSRQG